MVRLPGWFTRVEGRSMEPALHDRQLVWTRALRPADPIRRGDLVVVDATEAGRRVVKRVVGLPGERIDLRSGRVFVDDEPLDEPYAAASRYNRTFQVPPGRYLLLGDNRDASTDSRSWDQPFPARDQLVGTVGR